MSQSPQIQQELTSENLDNLPMFNPLNHLAYVPRHTVFPVSPFFQSQGSMQPRRNTNNKNSRHDPNKLTY